MAPRQPHDPASDAATSPPPDRAPAPARRRRWTSPGRILAVGAALAIAAMWGYVFLFHLAGNWESDRPAMLEESTFPAAAQPRCADAQRELAELPQAWETETPTERADAVEGSVEVLASLVRSLSLLPAGGPADQERVGEWLADWETYIGDRADYAERLREDPSARFYVTQSDRDERQITVAIDHFATENEMPACETPADLS